MEQTHSPSPEVIAVALAHGIELSRPSADVRRVPGALGSGAAAACPVELLAGPKVAVLHRRVRTGHRCARDHVALGPSGVFVVGVEHCAGEPVQTQVVGGMIAPERTELLVRGRVSNGLVDRVEAEAAEVAALLADAGRPDVVVSPMLWLIGATLPVLHGRLTVGRTSIVGTRRLRHALARRGPLDALQRYRLRALLAESFDDLA